MTKKTSNSVGPDAEIAIVMPCFNSARTIESAIASIQAQTFGNWELVVIDDGSTDGSDVLVRELAAQDRRIRIACQRNSGPAVARNRGVEIVTAPFVAFLDSDDAWDRDHLALHLASLQADASLGVSFGRCRFMDEAGRTTGDTTRSHPRDVQLEEVLAGNPTATCSSLVVRREVFDTAGRMRHDMVHAEDQEWLFRVVHAGWRVRGTEQVSVSYRVNAQGLSAQTDKMLHGWRTAMDHARNLAPDIVARSEARACGSMRLYHARFAMRSRQHAHVVLQHMLAALAADPACLLRSPVSVAACFAYSLLPTPTLALCNAYARARHV